MLMQTENIINKMSMTVQGRLQNEFQRYERVSNSRVLSSFEDIINFRKIKLDLLTAGLKIAYTEKVSVERAKFAELTVKLDTLSPLKILSRGYAVAKKDGEIISSKEQADINDNIEIVLSDGSLECKVTGRK